MNDLATVLDGFAEHIARRDIDHRPQIWAAYIDIWDVPQGEIGVADPLDVTNTCFALLSPWALIPTIGSAWLVVDVIDDLRVTNLKVNMRGMFEPHWSVPYRMADDGVLSFGEPVSIPMTPVIGQAVVGAKRARSRQTFWEMGHSMETMLPAVEALLR